MAAFKRWACLVLTFVMLLGMVPTAAFAQETQTSSEEILLSDPVPETEGSEEPTQQTEAAEPETPEATQPEIPETEATQPEIPETELPETGESFEGEPLPQEELEPVFDSLNLVKLEIWELPEKCWYQVGEELDLTGISLYAEDCIGLFQMLSDADVTILSGDTSVAGRQSVTLGYGNLEVSFEIYVHTVSTYGDILQDRQDYPESEHNYPNSAEIYYEYQVPGARQLTLVFSADTFFENGYDTLTLYDGEGNSLGRYTGSSLSGTTVTVPGDRVTLFLDTDGSASRYGFSLDSIYAFVMDPVHEPADAGVSTPPQCFADGYTTHTCWICGESFVQTHTGSAAHRFAEGSCSLCGLPENQIAGGSLGDTMAWALTGENVLYVSGTGDMSAGITWPEEAYAATGLVVGEGITSLSSQAFYGFSALQTVQLPGSLSAIGSNAFRDCTGLTEIYIPEGVFEIYASSYSKSPFYGCDSDLVIYCAAAEPQWGWEKYWNYRSSGGTLSVNYGFTREDFAYWLGFDNTAEHVVIREGITVIPAKAFYDCRNLLSVTLPESLVSIGDHAFRGCGKLTEVTIPENVMQIGKYAFAECAALTQLTLPSGLTELGIRVLSGTTHVKKLNFPANLTQFGSDSGEGVLTGSYVESVAFDEGMTVIPDYALYGAGQVTDITMPDTVTAIGEYAFAKCSKLQTIRLSKDLTYLGSYAFSQCTSLTAVEIPAGVADIGAYTFRQCSKLTDLTLNTGLITIAEYAFSDCSALTELTIPEGVTFLGERVFADCSKLTAVSLPETLQQMGSYAFSGCQALNTVKLPEGLQELGNSVFYGCAALKELRLPSTLSVWHNNGNRGVLDGSGITKVIFADGFTAIPDYALSNYSAGTGSAHSSHIQEVVFEAPEKITSIGTNAFYNCAALESITLPSGITSLPNRVFYGCHSLNRVVLPEKLATIHKEAFFDCKALERVTLPASLKTLDDYAFRGCTALTAVELPEGLQTLGNSLFYGCLNLKELRLPGTITTMEHNGNQGPLDGSGITKVIFGDGFTKVPAYALSGSASSVTHTYASRIKEVVFEAPEKITHIENYAFQNCLAMEQFAMPENVISMGNSTFSGCQRLQSVIWNSSLTKVGEYGFYNCNDLTQVILPDNITEIGKYAFAECDELQTAVIPENAGVRGYAFQNCDALDNLTIGDNACLYNYAFSGCDGMKVIRIGKNVTIEAKAFHNVLIKGDCGENMSWSVNISTGTLTLTGSGDMPDYSPENPAPWYGCADLVEHIAFDSRITGIGAYAFLDCRYLEVIELPDTIRTISESSFSGCDSITYLELPDGIRHIGENAFADCGALEEVVFLGDAPVLENNCFGTAPAQVFYPETASGYIARIFEKFLQYLWTKWDDTIPSKDVVILLDTSGSMDGKEKTLSSASTQLIKSIGGATKKTDMAVVEYDSGTNVLTDFTSSVYRLSSAVANLNADGGTAYRTALNKANSMLSGRNSDIKFVIMFSDGEPNDNKSDIYALANTMREQGIIIYTVGLLSSSSQRQVLINVAGSESRYFEATNIAGLVAAFEELSKNFGKSEYTTGEMKINDERHDIFNEPYTLCLTSDVPVSFYFTLGTNEMYDNAVSFAIEQNGKYPLSNNSGIFENIVLGKYFRSDMPMYMVLLDASGNVIERKELLLNFVESYNIRYLMGPEMNNEEYLEETFIPGDRIAPPAEPKRVGFDFVGWYPSENGEGVDFFTALEQMGTQKLEEDITLYAKWDLQDTELDLGVETWTFGNSNRNFNCTHYEMTVNDLARLRGTATYNEIAYLNDARFPQRYDENLMQFVPSWGGSCFGMSSSVLLYYFRDISIYNFPANGTSGKKYTTIGSARLTYNTQGDADVGAIESMINFYQLRQMLGTINDVRTNYTSHKDGTDSGNLKRIIQKMKKANAPVLMTISLVIDRDHYGGHAVVAYDLEEYADHYSFKVYDCSQFGTETNPIYYTVDVAVWEDGTYTASCSEWENAWSNYNYIFFKTALTVQELKSLPILTAPNSIRSRTTGSLNGDMAGYVLTTSYGDFTITDGKHSAVISNGERVSGDLDILCHGLDNEVEMAHTYRFTLPGLSGNSSYTITQSGSGGYKTALIYFNAANGFYVTHKAVEPGTVIIGADGSIGTRYASAVEQELNVTHNDLSTPWYTVQVIGESSGLQLAPDGDSVNVVSAEETAVDITAKSDFNQLTLTDVPVGTEAAEIQDSDGSCVVVQEDQIVAGEVYGYSVAFNSQMGTSVPTLTNVPQGSLISEPTDPTKTGAIFQGWFVDKEYTRLWDFDTDVVTQDTILYAGWSVDPNYLKSVTFRVPGQEDQIVYIPKGETVPESYAPLGTKGETLVWYTNAAYTSPQWNFETDTVTSDTVLYGKTTLCMVRYVTNNGQTLEDSQLYSGMKISRPTGLTLEGHTFCGWYADGELTREWNFETDRVTGDMILYAKWLSNEQDKEGNDTGICIEILHEDSYVYTGKAIKPQILVRDEGRILTPGVDYTVSYKNNTNARNKDDASVKESKLPQIIIQGKGNYKSTKKITKYFTIHQANMQDLQISLPTALACKANNKLQTLKATVSTAEMKLAASAYSIRYYTDPQLTAEVKGITQPGMYYVVLEAKLDKNGSYSGNLRGATAPIAVEAAPAAQMLNSAKITLPKTVTSLSAKPETEAAIAALIAGVTVNKVEYRTDGEHLETFMEQFTVTAVDTDGSRISQEELGVILMSAGKKTLTVTAKPGNSLGLVGEKTATVTVKGAALNKKQFQVTFDQTGKTNVTKSPYSGVAQTPAVISQLKAGTDYTVTFKSGKNPVDAMQVKNAGSYSLVITGKGAYSGSLSYSFSITKVDIVKAYASGNLKLTSAGEAVYTPIGAELPLSAAYVNAQGSRIAMAEGRDYTLSYSGNKAVTEAASMTLKGKGNFSGTLTKKAAPELIFSVTAGDIASVDIAVTVSGLTVKKGQITGVKYTLTHSGKKIAANQYNGQLTDNGDETLTLTITGSGKLYTGSRSLRISTNLIKVTDSKQVKITLPKENRYYTGSQICPEVIITDAQGNDISHCFSITYGENTKVGSADITITGLADQGYYGAKTLKFTILPKWAKWIFG